MVAGRGIAMLVTGGQITTVNERGLPAISPRLPRSASRSPRSSRSGWSSRRRSSSAARALGLLIEADRHQPGGQPPGRRPGPDDHLDRLRLRRRSVPGLAGLIIAANTNSVNANSLGLWIELDAILAVVIGGTALTGGRFSLAGTLVGALFITTLGAHHPQRRHPVRGQLPVQGGRGRRGVPPPVARGRVPPCAVRRPDRLEGRPRHEHRQSPPSAPPRCGTGSARTRQPPRFLPLIVTIALFAGMFGAGSDRATRTSATRRCSSA